jgi:hypothetical protein
VDAALVAAPTNRFVMNDAGLQTQISRVSAEFSPENQRAGISALGALALAGSAMLAVAGCRWWRKGASAAQPDRQLELQEVWASKFAAAAVAGQTETAVDGQTEITTPGGFVLSSSDSIDPRLLAFVRSSAYREFLQVLNKLNDIDKLDRFLDKALESFKTMNIFDLMELERREGGPGILGAIRKAWPNIWPENLEEESIDSYGKFSRLWRRLESTKLVDDLMEDILPGIGKPGQPLPGLPGGDAQPEGLTDEKRNEMILDRIGDNELVRQYIAYSRGDPDLKNIGIKMMPFMAGCVATIERKMTLETALLEQTLSRAGIFLAVFAVAVVILSGTGILPTLQDIWNYNWLPGVNANKLF